MALEKDYMRSVAYFWLERGDVTRYCKWNEAYRQMHIDLPMLAHAFDHYFFFKSIITAHLQRVMEDFDNADSWQIPH